MRAESEVREGLRKLDAQIKGLEHSLTLIDESHPTPLAAQKQFNSQLTEARLKRRALLWVLEE